jgi:hypothetical protein
MDEQSGERECLRLTLSGGREVRILFSGPYPTQAEIDELMDYLTVSRRTFPASIAALDTKEQTDG